jgi:hypothetical protein
LNVIWKPIFAYSLHALCKFSLHANNYYQNIIINSFLTFIMVELHTGTNFPAVSVNSLLAVAMMKTRQRWNETGVPTQSQPQAASLTLSAWNNVNVVLYRQHTCQMCMFVLRLKWNYTLFTCSVSSVPSQQYTNTLNISMLQYKARACDTSVKSPQLYKRDNEDNVKIVWTCCLII